jgi:hypothetical protein
MFVVCALAGYPLDLNKTIECHAVSFCPVN